MYDYQTVYLAWSPETGPNQQMWKCCKCSKPNPPKAGSCSCGHGKCSNCVKTR